MQPNYRSNICAEVTDETTTETLKMTDKFLEVFYSQESVEVSPFIMAHSIWRYPGDFEIEPCWVMSPQMTDRYKKWEKELPPLLKELK